MVQLKPVHPAVHIHLPSVGSHVSGLQFGEHRLEQLLPKYPFKQASLTKIKYTLNGYFRRTLS